MRRIHFTVDDLPPKKGGAKSMWGKTTDTEPKRLIALRSAAVQKLSSSPFTGPVRLKLSIHVGNQADVVKNSGRQGFGDLDTFVSGVCDGLMAAHDNTLRVGAWHKVFDDCHASVHPREAIAYTDDSQIMEICARKVIDRSLGRRVRYEVELEELRS